MNLVYMVTLSSAEIMYLQDQITIVSFILMTKAKSWAEAGTPVPPSSSALWGLACNDQAEVIAAYNTEDTDAFYVYKRNLTNGEWANITLPIPMAMLPAWLPFRELKPY